MRILNRSLIAVFLAGLAVAAWLHFLAPDRIAPRLLQALQSASGRAVLAEGGAGYRLLPAPGIVLRGLRIANPAGSGAGFLVSAPQAAVEIDLRALILGRFAVSRLVLEAPLVMLAIDAQGNANWRVRGGADQPAPPMPVVVTLNDGRVAYRDETSGEQLTVEGLSALIKPGPGAGEIEADGMADWRGSPAGSDLPRRSAPTTSRSGS